LKGNKKTCQDSGNDRLKWVVITTTRKKKGICFAYPFPFCFPPSVHFLKNHYYPEFLLLFFDYGVIYAAGGTILWSVNGIAFAGN